MIKPLGIYGSKDEIVRLLRTLNAVDEEMCVTFFKLIAVLDNETHQCTLTTFAN
jgi:hypothetical protein